VSITLPFGSASLSASVILPLLIRGPAGAIVNHVTAQYQDQGRLLEETKRDLEVFKKAYYKAESEMHDREARFEQERQALADEIYHLKAREKRVVVLIDGDGAIFLPSLIADGKRGGHEAASRLTENIKAHLDPQQFQLHVYVFYNRRGLIATLKRSGYGEAATTFDDFVVGFNQAAERFAMIDAGELKEGSDHKMRAYLDDNIYSAQTLKVLFGGCHDNGYVSALNSFITSGHKEKLILLPGYADKAMGIEKLGLPSLAIPDLFLAEKISQFSVQHTTDRSRTPTPPTSPPPPGLVHPSSLGIVRPTIISQSVRESCFAPVRRGSDPGTLNRPAIECPASYKSVVQSKVLVGGDSYAKSAMNPIKGSPIPLQMDNLDMVVTGASGHGSPPRRINPKIPIWKHTPPPCTLFYLANCKFGSECQYGHDYMLSEDDYETIRTNAKNNPCTAIMKGEECPWGSKCVYGHVCPNAPRCPRHTIRKCKFSGEGMHAVA
ncbi:hypothetical protein BDM02DRAFT_3101039, partial [Thelephora ganbajun]